MTLKTSKIMYLFVLIGYFNLSMASVKMTLVGGYSNQFVFRGAPVWTGPAVFAGPGFVFFEKLEVNGPNIGWGFFPRENQHQLKVAVKFFDDGKPLLPLDDTKKTYRNSRSTTINSLIEYKYKFGWNNKFHIGFLFEKELKEHQGLYSEFELSAPVLPFTNLSFGLSFAEKSSNQYAYGKEAQSGVGYHRFKLSNIIPFLPWAGRILTSLSYDVVTSGRARHADLVRGDYKNWTVSTLWMWDVF